MSVGNVVRRAIYGKMAGDTGTGGLVKAGPTYMLGTAASGYTKAIYSDVAPADTGFPFIVFFQTSSVPINMIGPVGSQRQELDNDLWTIKAVVRMARPTELTVPTNQSAQDAAEEIQARLDALLTNGTISISGGTLCYLRRESDVNYAETTDGVTYYHRGCVFRLIWQ